MAINDAGMFTVKEINRLKILQDVIDRNIRPRQAAEMLGITPRHCSRLLKRYRQYGPLGMNNQSRGRTGNRLLPASLTDQALSIIREHYRDFGRKRLVRTVLIFTESSDQLSRATDRVPGLPASPGYVQ